MKQVYMDHSATTPADPQVYQAIKPYFMASYGNPSTIYSLGREAKEAVEKAREQVASLINAQPGEVYFTGGGTEAANQAIISYMLRNRNRGNHVITSAVEHHAVLDACRFLEKQGFELTVLPVSPEGLVDPDDLRSALKANTLLVSIMHANNEVGTIQPLKELAAVSRSAGAVFHTDAVQSVGKIPVNVEDLGVDMLSASSHKIYGPKGAGCLYIRKGTRIKNYLHGGAQERKKRPGTENVPGVVGFGKAAELARQNLLERNETLVYLAERLKDGILNNIPCTRLTGHPVHRIPGHVSVCFEFVEGESILLMLDNLGIMASSGSACTSGSLNPSHVLLAMGLSHEIAHGSLRLTLGKNNTEEDVDYVIEVLPGVIHNLREMSPLTPHML